MADVSNTSQPTLVAMQRSRRDTARHVSTHCARCGEENAPSGLTDLCPNCGLAVNRSIDWSCVDRTSMTVSLDHYCGKCQYNLRMQPLTGQCPECGQAVAMSLTPKSRVRQSPEHLRRLGRTSGLLAVTFLLAVPAVFVSQMRWPVALVMFLLCLGLWRRFEESVSDTPKRTYFLIFAGPVLAILLSIAGSVAIAQQEQEIGTAGLICSGMVGVMLPFIAILRRLRCILETLGISQVLTLQRIAIAALVAWMFVFVGGTLWAFTEIREMGWGSMWQLADLQRPGFSMAGAVSIVALAFFAYFFWSVRQAAYFRLPGMQGKKTQRETE